MSNISEIFRGAPHYWTTYQATIKHDGGKFKRTVKAENVWDAKTFIGKALNCPESAITDVKVYYPSLTIHQVRRMHLKEGGTFFNKYYMKTFGQRLSDFSVVKDGTGRYIVSAPQREWRNGIQVFTQCRTEVIFNPETGKFSAQ